MVELGDLVEFRRGLTYKKSDEVESSSSGVLRANNVDLVTGQLDLSDIRYLSDNVEVPRTRKLVVDSLLICTASGSRAHLGKMAHISTAHDFAFGGFMGLLVPKPEVSARYLWYFSRSDDYRVYLDSLAPGANINNLRFDDLAGLELPLPPLDEQKRIVAKLDQAFAALDRARTNAEANLADAEALFDAHVDAVLSGVERKWSTKSLGDIADFRNGINFTRASRGKQIRVLGVKDFKNYFHAPDAGLDHVTIDGDFDASDSLRRGDIVFVRSNGNPELIGRSLVVETMSECTAHSGFTIRARLRNEEVSPEFIGHFVKSSAVRRKMVDGGVGTNIKSLNQGTLSQLRVSYPDRNEQEKIVERLDAVRDETRRIETLCTEKLADIAALRQSLLQAAFSGQLS